MSSSFSLPGRKMDENNVDQLMAQELNQLSFQDRNRIQEEIHGVHFMAPEETPLMISDALHLLDREIMQIPDANKQAYLKAHSIHPNAFVLQTDYRLKFLRATLFDTKKAATRYTNHLYLLLKYFGTFALERPVRYSDLSKQDHDVYRLGQAQVLPSRDRSGRLICVHYGSIGGPKVNPSVRIRILLYMYAVVAQDIDTQRLGAVAIFIAAKEHFERYNTGSKEYQADVSLLMKCNPVRWSAAHTFLPEGPFFDLIKRLLVTIMISKDDSVRYRFYSGSLASMESQYKLLSYGINVQDLPVTHSGSLKTKKHAQWIKFRRMVEDEDAEDHDVGVARWVQCPLLNDVLFRRGGISTHYGNVTFQELMLARLNDYNAATGYAEKRAIRESILTAVQSKQGRILEYNTIYGCWAKIDDPAAIHNKFINAINDLNRSITARRQHQSNRSDTESFLSKRRKIDDQKCFCSTP